MKNNRTVSAIILAAGNSTRFGAVNKLEVNLCGKTVLEHTINCFLQSKYIDEVIIVAKSTTIENIRSFYAPFSRVKFVEGGVSRNESSLIGVKNATSELVLVHDGARPFIDDETIVNCIDALEKYDAVAAAVKATDTIKLCDENGVVRSTTNRALTWQTQSPQAFRRNVYLKAYSSLDPNDPRLTDDCMVMELNNIPVKLIESKKNNIKITTRDDIVLAEAIAKDMGIGGALRIATAIGQDSHRTRKKGSTDKPMILGGVIFDEYPALDANSDGDVVLHAITNAVSGITGVNILGAIADKICQSGIKDSRVYLEEALKYLRGKITHISMTIECNYPKISPKVSEMRKSIGEILDLPPQRVGITATTGEQLTDFSRGHGISVFCIATAEVYS